jgi:hypothetical protein
MLELRGLVHQAGSQCSVLDRGFRALNDEDAALLAASEAGAKAVASVPPPGRQWEGLRAEAARACRGESARASSSC